MLTVTAIEYCADPAAGAAVEAVVAAAEGWAEPPAGAADALGAGVAPVFALGGADVEFGGQFRLETGTAVGEQGRFLLRGGHDLQ